MENSKKIKQIVQSYSINEELLENDNIKLTRKPYKYIIILVCLIIVILALIIAFIIFEIKNNSRNKLNKNGFINQNNETLKNNDETLNKDDDIYENPEFQRLCDLLPAFLKSDSEGNFHLDKSGFKYTPNNKKKYKEE